MARTAQNSSHKPIEKYVEAVELQGGIYTNYPVVVNNSLTANSLVNKGAETITAKSANAFTVGPNGTTNPTFNVNTNTTSAATGITLVSAAAAGGFALQETSSGTNESMTIDAKGSGTVGINTLSTTSGAVTIGNSTSNAGLVVNGTVTSGGTLLPQYVYLSTGILAAASFAANTSYPFWTAPNSGNTWKIAFMSARFTTAAGSAATFQVEVAGAGTAPGSGTAQNSSGVALNGSANTTVNATITTQTTISAGSSINFVVGSTATTSLAGLVISVVLQRVS